MTLLFDRDAIIDSFEHNSPDILLVRLLRLIFYIRNVTLDDFSNLYHRYGRRMSWSQSKIRTMKTNDRDAIGTQDRVTMDRFMKMICGVLCLDIVSLSVIVREEDTGRIITYSSDDVIIEKDGRDM